jgi:hypothetical protein
MTFDPARIQKFTTQDPPTWLQVGDHEAYVGYVADEDEGKDTTVNAETPPSRRAWPTSSRTASSFLLTSTCRSGSRRARQ